MSTLYRWQMETKLTSNTDVYGGTMQLVYLYSVLAYSGKALADMLHFLCHLPLHKLERNVLLPKHVKLSHCANGDTSGLLLQGGLHISRSLPHHETQTFLKLHAALEEQKSIHSSVFNRASF